jgi:hypothetical protein
VAEGPIEANKKTSLLSGWMIVVIVAIVAVAAVGITALATRSSTDGNATTTTKVPASTTTTVAPTTTLPVTTKTVAAPTTTVMIDKITSGVYGRVVWQTGDPLGSNPGPHYCCFPPPPGSPLGMDYSGSRGCSGGADQNGNLVGVFTFVQLPRGCPRSGIEHLETLGSIMCLRF